MEKWERKGGIAEKSYTSSQRKSNSGWEHNRQDFNHRKSFTLDSDIEQISLMDLGEIDFEESREGEKL